MREDQFIKLSQAGENVQIEYKTCYEQISDSLYETVCSFLNHSGGHILVGVKDNGEIAGVNPDKATTLQGNIITAIKNPDLFLPCPYFTPQILTVEGKVVLYLDIPCGQYVYRYKGKYWDRNGDADIDVTDQPELLLSLFERKNPHLFEERIVEELRRINGCLQRITIKASQKTALFYGFFLHGHLHYFISTASSSRLWSDQYALQHVSILRCRDEWYAH